LVFLTDIFCDARTCVTQCEETGSIGDISIQHCPFLGEVDNSSWYMQEPLYMQWKQLNCRSDCRYHCMIQRESEREKLGLNPVKYHGKWPFRRVHVFQVCVSPINFTDRNPWTSIYFPKFSISSCYHLSTYVSSTGLLNANSIQEPVSAALSALNLMMHFTGWLSFFMLVNYKLPLRPQSKRTYYEYTGLWHIYGLLSMSAWFWSAIFHAR